VHKIVFAGIDIGSLTAKALILEDKEILGFNVIRVKKTPVESAESVFEEILSKININRNEVQFVVSTGYGRDNIPFSDKSMTEITCHGLGAHFLISSVRTIIDIGGQDCKIISVDRTGKLVEFAMNEKCSAGTGRYLEIMANLLHISLDELGTLSLKSKTPVQLKSTCSIYAQAEVLQCINSGFKKTNIAAGINKAMAERVYSMSKKVKMRPDVVISGGVAKNAGVVGYLEEMIGIEFLKLPIDPQIIGALGAAVIAQERYKRK